MGQIKNQSRRVYGKSKVQEQLFSFLSKNASYLLEDLEGGVIHHQSTQWRKKLKKSVEIYTLTSVLGDGYMMRNWFWVTDGKVELVNTEVKFKMSRQEVYRQKLSLDRENQVNTSSSYVSIGGNYLSLKDI